MYRELETLAAERFFLPSKGGLSFLVYAGLEIVTAIIFEKHKECPVGVLKISRRPGQNNLNREFEILSHVKGHAPPNFAQTVPAVFGLNKAQGLVVLALEFLRGRRRVLNLQDACSTREFFKRIRGWIGELGKIPLPEGKPAISRFPEARQRILQAVGRTSPDARILAAIEAIRGFDESRFRASVPAVITHRDLAPSNVLFDGGQIGVIDWGNSHYGYPLIDWVRFACNAVSRGRHPKDFPCALEELLSGQSAASGIFFEETKELVRGYALSPALVPVLFLLSLFDYCESYYLSEDRAWEEDFKFIFERGEWLEKLGR